MKFGESLTEGEVPEWKTLYVNYKGGKKIIRRIGENIENNEARPTISSDITPLLDPSRRNTVYGPDGENSVSSAQQTQGRDRRNVGSSQYSSVDSKEANEHLQSDIKEFLSWIDGELSKVNKFYKLKERDGYERFLILEDQLYTLKDHFRNQKRKTRETSQLIEAHPHINNWAYRTKKALLSLKKYELPSLPSGEFLERWRNKKDDDYSRDTIDRPISDENFAEDQTHADSSETNGQSNYSTWKKTRSSADLHNEDGEGGLRNYQNMKTRDYERKRQTYAVPYAYAKRRLKEAMFEYYRTLSLIQSYRVLNRTAFRKITKKFSKVTGIYISEEYMKKVDASYFQASDVIDTLTSQVEELYLNFIDRSSKDRKKSLERLKIVAYAFNNTAMKPETFYTSFFSSGFFIGFGIPLFVLALYLALHGVFSGLLPEGRYMLQIYGGFFLIILLLIFFGINLVVFEHFRINYKFIFEFDISTALDFRQYFLLPSFGFFFFSLIAWFSFENFWPSAFPGRYWPCLYLVVMVIIFMWPGNQFYALSRRWLQVGLFRLVLSGLYPVEFRDFFMGDIFCSLSYTVSNLSFFFCLYAHLWRGIINGNSGANTCGSNKSRSMGFLQSLPSIWRLLQCLRRFADSGDGFPHLANMVKYGLTTIYYCLLSVYRINVNGRNKAVFIVFASINSVYSSIWDLAMDWSLLQFTSKNFLLRDNLFYKFPIYYYLAMIIDVILRFQWIPYVVTNRQLQQLQVSSFFVAFAETLRRGIWISLRLENEHTSNIVLFRASRDSPLPYPTYKEVEDSIKKLIDLKYPDLGETSDFGATAEVQPPVKALRLPRLVQKLSSMRKVAETFRRAHIKDFQRKPFFAGDTQDADDFTDDDDYDDNDENSQNNSN